MGPKIGRRRKYWYKNKQHLKEEETGSIETDVGSIETDIGSIETDVHLEMFFSFYTHEGTINVSTFRKKKSVY